MIFEESENTRRETRPERNVAEENKSHLEEK
jgi:hypothetical protein